MEICYSLSLSYSYHNWTGLYVYNTRRYSDSINSSLHYLGSSWKLQKNGFIELNWRSLVRYKLDNLDKGIFQAGRGEKWQTEEIEFL